MRAMCTWGERTNTEYSAVPVRSNQPLSTVSASWMEPTCCGACEAGRPSSRADTRMTLSEASSTSTHHCWILLGKATSPHARNVLGYRRPQRRTETLEKIGHAATVCQHLHEAFWALRGGTTRWS